MGWTWNPRSRRSVATERARALVPTTSGKIGEGGSELEPNATDRRAALVHSRARNSSPGGPRTRSTARLTLRASSGETPVLNTKLRHRVRIHVQIVRLAAANAPAQPRAFPRVPRRTVGVRPW